MLRWRGATLPFAGSSTVIRESASLPRTLAGSPLGFRPEAEEADLRLEAVEKRHILAMLEAAGGNKSAAARTLGISRKTLERKLKAWEGG